MLGQAQDQMTTSTAKSFASTLLHENAALLKETIHDFAEREIAPLAESIDKTNVFPRELWPKLGAMGLLGVTIPEIYGGSGLGYLEHVVAMEEISRASAAIGLSYGAHSNLCMNQIRLHGTETQKQKYLPLLCAGQHVGALAMSEVQAGSDVMSLQLKAEYRDGYFELTGNKMWITNGPDADTLVVYARTNHAQDHVKSRGISAFIIEKNFQGFSTAQKLDKLGMRGSSTSELVFEKCRVPEANLLGKINEGAKVLMSGLDYERIILAAGPLGIMQACLDLVLPYVHTRKQFGKPIGEFELIQAKLADMYTALMTARTYVYAIANACDQGKTTRKEAASAILYASEKATWMACETIQCLGGNGYINEFPAGRLWRDAKLYEIGAGTSEIRRMLIGRTLFEETKE